MKSWLSNNWLPLLLIIAFAAYFIFHKQTKSDDLYEYQLKEVRDSLTTVQHDKDSLQQQLDATANSVINHADALQRMTLEAQLKILYELKKNRNAITVPDYGSDSLRRYYSQLRSPH